MDRRSQEERDALTVEIGFAVLTGGLLAVAAFFTVSAAALLPLPGVRSGVLLGLAAGVAALVFAGRVVDVLARFSYRDQLLPSFGQVKQPGRPSPDS